MSRPEPRAPGGGARKHIPSFRLNSPLAFARARNVAFNHTGMRGGRRFGLGATRQLLAREQGWRGGGVEHRRAEIGQSRVATPTSMDGPTGQSRAVHLGHRHLVGGRTPRLWDADRETPVTGADLSFFSLDPRLCHFFFFWSFFFLPSASCQRQTQTDTGGTV